MSKMKPDAKLIEKGKLPFEIETTYQLLETGTSKPFKPLIVYLHGYKQNIPIFERKTTPLHQLEAYHLYIKGPYPIPLPDRKIEEWGAAWYLYDGDQQKFIDSLERTSQLLENTIDEIKEPLKTAKTVILGYSMGGYQSGYFALTRPEKINHAVVISARIKDELVTDNWHKLKETSFFAIHGERDKSVKMEPQQKSVNNLNKHGVKAELVVPDTGHKLDDSLVNPVYKWLKENL